MEKSHRRLLCPIRLFARLFFTAAPVASVCPLREEEVILDINDYVCFAQEYVIAPKMRVGLFGFDQLYTGDVFPLNPYLAERDVSQGEEVPVRKHSGGVLGGLCNGIT